MLPYYETMLEDVEGHLYYNMQSYAAALLPMPRGRKLFESWKKMVGVPESVAIPIPPVPEARWSEVIRSICRLARFALRQQTIMEAYLRRADEKLAALEGKRGELIGVGARAILTELLAEVEAPQDLALAVFNDYFIMKAKATESETIHLDSIKPELALEEIRKLTLSAGDLAILRETANLPACRPSDLMARLSDNRLKDELNSFLENYGSRCFGDLKLETKTFRQNIAPLCRLMLLPGSIRPLQGAGHGKQSR